MKNVPNHQPETVNQQTQCASFQDVQLRKGPRGSSIYVYACWPLDRSIGLETLDEKSTAEERKRTAQPHAPPNLYLYHGKYRNIG